MKAKYISVMLILVFCPAILLGQEGITEGSTIELNKVNVKSSQNVLPKITRILPDVDIKEPIPSTDQRILIYGKIDNRA